MAVPIGFSIRFVRQFDIKVDTEEALLRDAKSYFFYMSTLCDPNSWNVIEGENFESDTDHHQTVEGEKV